MQHGPSQNIKCTCTKVCCLVFGQHTEYKCPCTNSWIRIPTLNITIIPTTCHRNYPKAPEWELSGVTSFRCGLGSSVGLATVYGLDGLGIESRWGARFSAPVQTSPEAHPASCTMGTGPFPGVRCGRGWRWPLSPSTAEIKNRVELYLYSP